MHRWLVILLMLPCLGVQAVCAADPTACEILFTDVTAQTGITFKHSHGGSGRNYIVEFMSAGLALFDYDNDGWTDIYFLNGAPLKGTVTTQVPRNQLYRNNGNGTFSNVTVAAGVGDARFGLGVVAGDFDNDGHQDLYVNNFGANVLYRNNGDGTFTDTTATAKVASGNQVGGGVCFVDVDNDGNLDLYVGNYVRFSFDEDTHADRKRRQFFSGPSDFAALPDTLFRNKGDGTFSDASDASGIGSLQGATMGIICFDYEEDGDSDIFICNDAMRNFLFQNDGTGHFQEQGLASGLAYNYQGNQNGSMGVDCADYDGDGLLDLVMTNYMREMPVIYHNLDSGMFEDQANIAGITGRAFPETTWGTSWGDFDNDGDCDLFMACGHFFESATKFDDAATYRAANLLFMNVGNGTFVDVTRQCGNGLAVVQCSRGVAFADIDNDGDLDAAILNSNTQPTIMRNDSTGGNWLRIALRDNGGNRNGVGARIQVFAENTQWTAEVHCGRGYQSHATTDVHFGLGSARTIDRVEVHWLGSAKETFRHVSINQRVVLVHGSSVPRAGAMGEQ